MRIVRSAPKPRSSVLAFLRGAALMLTSALCGSIPAVAGADLPIPILQGRGAASPFAGRLVGTHGAVTRVDSNGFFLQDIQGDDDARTSDAVFVFTGAAPGVRAGQCIHVDGRVEEFDAGAPGNARAGARTVTELHPTRTPRVLHDGCEVRPVELSLPLPEGDDPRRFEGMLVTLHGPLMVQQNYFLGRFGELTLAVGGRVEAPTNRHRPGAAAQALASENARRMLLLDDGDARQNPSPVPWLGDDGSVRAGDTVPEITGVIDVGPRAADTAVAGLWKILPTRPVRFTRANPRTPAPAAVGGTLKVAAANVDNFFSTLADGRGVCAPRHVATDCRGARSAQEFERQRAKLVAQLAAIDADAVGLMEIQNNGATALQSLVDALNVRLGAAPYVRIDDPAEGGGTDAIKVALIYKPTRLRPIGAARSDVDAVHERPPLAQTFEMVRAAGAASSAGERFNLVVDHFKSRRCTGAAGVDLDQGDLQGCWNHRRTLQAQALRRFAAEVQRRSGVDDTLLVGDFNAYAHEDPVVELIAHGFADQIERFDPSGYSFVFDGAAGRLDQVFASASLAGKVTGVTEWHVNADEPALLDYSLAWRAPACARCAPDAYAPTPYRASDHDPVIVGLRLGR